MKSRIAKAAGLMLTALVLAGCSAAVTGPASPSAAVPAFAEQLPPSRQYAGEVLAYLMRVVLGRAGPADLRAQWSTRGLSVPLDFRRISRIMREPGRNRSELVVLDTRILGISEVLYRYDPGLNLFKGADDRQSIFPSAELLALRLLLLQKMHRGEKIRLQGLLERRRLLTDPLLVPQESDLYATGLSAVEMHLIREVLASDPHLFSYLFSPAMVSGLYELGAVAVDSFVLEVLKAEERQSPVCRFAPSSDPAAVRIALLPSMVSGFEPVDGRGKAPAALRPAPCYRRACSRLKERILSQVQTLLLPERLPDNAVVFSNQDMRPLAIFPENADAVLARLCPSADFALILLGKDVIRSFDLDPKPGGVSGSRRLYIDVTDVDRSWIDPDIEAVSGFIVRRLEGRGTGKKTATVK